MHDHQTEERDQAAKAPPHGRRDRATHHDALLDLHQQIGNTAFVQRMAESEVDVQRAADEQRAAVDDAAKAPGQRLAPDVQAELNESTGDDHSELRYHDDAASHKAAEAVGALAYTTGKDVYFGRGQFQPHTSEGMKRLKHEAGHTLGVGGSPSGRVQANGVQVSDVDGSDEKAADAYAEGKHRHAHDGPKSDGVVQRVSDDEQTTSSSEATESDASEDLEPRERARAHALRYARAARIALYAVENSREAHALSVRFFGEGHGEDDLLQIGNSYDAAIAALANVQIKDWPNAPKGFYAKSRRGGSIKVSALFDAKSLREQALTLLHEATHVAEDTHDGSNEQRRDDENEQSGEDGNLEAALAFAQESPSAAITCAYNLEYFAGAVNLRKFEFDSDTESSSGSGETETSSSSSDSGEVDTGSDSGSGM